MLIFAKKNLAGSVGLVTLVLNLFVLPSFAQSSAIVSNDFEKGTEKWETRGDRVSISSSKDLAKSGVAFAEKAKSRAEISHVSQIEKTLDQRKRFTQLKMGVHIKLGQLIQRHNDSCDAGQDQIFFLHSSLLTSSGQGFHTLRTNARKLCR